MFVRKIIRTYYLEKNVRTNLILASVLEKGTLGMCRARRLGMKKNPTPFEGAM